MDSVILDAQLLPLMASAPVFVLTHEILAPMRANGLGVAPP